MTSVRFFSFTSRGMVEDRDGLWINRDDPAWNAQEVHPTSNLEASRLRDPYRELASQVLSYGLVRTESRHKLLAEWDRRWQEIQRLRAALESIERQLRGYANFSPGHELHRIAEAALADSPEKATVCDGKMHMPVTTCAACGALL